MGLDLQTETGQWVVDANHQIRWAEYQEGSWTYYDGPGGGVVTPVFPVTPGGSVKPIIPITEQPWRDKSVLLTPYALYESETGAFMQYDPVQGTMQTVQPAGDLYYPEFLDLSATNGVIDFREMPDLTTLGIDMTDFSGITSSSLTGAVNGTLDAVSGLQLTKVGTAGFNHRLLFKRIGAATLSGKSLSVVLRAPTNTSYLAGLAGLHYRAADALSANAHYALVVAANYESRFSGRLSSLFSGMDTPAGNVGNVSLFNDDNRNADLRSLNDLWLRFTVSSMGAIGGEVEAIPIDPSLATSADELFTSAVESGDRRSRVLPAGNGNQSLHGCLGLAISRSDNPLSIMAVRLA